MFHSFRGVPPAALQPQSRSQFIKCDDINKEIMLRQLMNHSSPSLHLPQLKSGGDIVCPPDTTETDNRAATRVQSVDGLRELSHFGVVTYQLLSLEGSA